MSPQPIIAVSNLTKFYGDFKALDSVSFAVEKGWVYGYLGPNGAGKTTTIRTMLGLLRPDQGEVQITGINPTKDPVHALQMVGYAPELPTLQTFFSGEQLMEFTGKMFGLAEQTRKERIKQLLDLVGLKEWGDKKIGNYSKGMVQRLSVALALINDPLVLLYSNLLFFSMAFMFSEVLRRTTLSMLAVIGILVASAFIGGILSTMHFITGEQLYLEISKWLPNWSASNLPSFVASELITAPESPFVSVSGGDIPLATAIIAVYTIASILTATLKLVRSDVTKRAD